MEHIATIVLILAVQTLTTLMWLQVTGEETVFKKLVTLHEFKLGDLCPSKEESINQSYVEFICFPCNQLKRRYLYFTWIPYARKTKREYYLWLWPWDLDVLPSLHSFNTHEFWMIYFGFQKSKFGHVLAVMIPVTCTWPWWALDQFSRLILVITPLPLIIILRL